MPTSHKKTQEKSTSTMAGGFLLILAIAGFFLARQEFFEAYLVGWLLWYTVAVGSLGFLMLQHLSGGGWGLAARRILDHPRHDGGGVRRQPWSPSTTNDSYDAARPPAP